MTHEIIGYFIPTIPNLAWFIAVFGGILMFLNDHDTRPPSHA